MLFYSIIMFILASIFLTMAYSVYRGFLGLIHEYHWQNVRREDYPAYGNAMGVGMFGFGMTFLLSGGIALFGGSRAVILTAFGVLMAGMLASLAVVAWAQKKYNGGWFSFSEKE